MHGHWGPRRAWLAPPQPVLGTRERERVPDFQWTVPDRPPPPPSAGAGGVREEASRLRGLLAEGQTLSGRCYGNMHEDKAHK